MRKFTCFRTWRLLCSVEARNDVHLYLLPALRQRALHFTFDGMRAL
jgi:hypothetical protein